MPICILCNYTTNRTNDFNRHIESQTHNIAVKKDIRKKQKRKEMKLKREQGKKEEFKIITDKLDKIQKTQKETNNGIKKITDYLDFLNKHCTDIEPVTMLTEGEIDEILGLDNYEEFEFEEMIAKYVKMKKLHIKLGNLLLKKFLNPNKLTERRIWSSDISRLIYLIFRIINKKKNWIRDKKGELFTELIIAPIITKIENLMREYKKYMLSKFDKNNMDENAIYLDNAQMSEHILSKFYIDCVKKDLLRYIAAKLPISVKHDELLEEIC